MVRREAGAVGVRALRLVAGRTGPQTGIAVDHAAMRIRRSDQVVYARRAIAEYMTVVRVEYVPVGVPSWRQVVDLDLSAGHQHAEEDRKQRHDLVLALVTREIKINVCPVRVVRDTWAPVKREGERGREGDRRDRWV